MHSFIETARYLSLWRKINSNEGTAPAHPTKSWRSSFWCCLRLWQGESTSVGSLVLMLALLRPLNLMPSPVSPASRLTQNLAEGAPLLRETLLTVRTGLVVIDDPGHLCLGCPIYTRGKPVGRPNLTYCSLSQRSVMDCPRFPNLDAKWPGALSSHRKVATLRWIATSVFSRLILWLETQHVPRHPCEWGTCEERRDGKRLWPVGR